MGIKVNLAGVATEMAPLPKGRYLCNVFSIEAKTAQSSGNPMLQWVFKVSPDHPDSEYVGRQLYHNTVLTREALWNLKRTLIALGDDPSDLDTEVDVEPDDYLGRECVIEVTHRMYQGEPRPQISRVLPSDAPLESDSADLSAAFAGEDVL
jgi:hypothetical protein